MRVGKQRLFQVGQRLLHLSLRVQRRTAVIEVRLPMQAAELLLPDAVYQARALLHAWACMGVPRSVLRGLLSGAVAIVAAMLREELGLARRELLLAGGAR